MKRWLLLLFVAACAQTAFAQAPATRVTPCSPTTPNNALCISGTPPAVNVDGTPTVLALTYRLEQRVGATGAWTVVGTQASAQFYVTNLAPGPYSYRMFAIAGGLESVASSTVTRAATAVPSPPVAPVITIAVVISPDAPPTVVQVNGAQVYATTRP